MWILLGPLAAGQPGGAPADALASLEGDRAPSEVAVKEGGPAGEVYAWIDERAREIGEPARVARLSGSAAALRCRKAA